MGESAGTRRSLVFIQDSVDMTQQPAVVRARLDPGADWLVPLAVAAGHDAQHPAATPPGAVDGASSEVQVRVGPPSDHQDGSLLAVYWEADPMRSSFPVLHAELQLVPLDAGRLVLVASYRAQPEGPGPLLDRAVLHRVAESTVHSFLQRVAEQLDAGS